MREDLKNLLHKIHTYLTTPRPGRNASWHSRERQLARAIELAMTQEWTTK